MLTISKSLTFAAIAFLCSGCATLPTTAPPSPSPAPTNINAATGEVSSLKIATWNTEHLAYPVDKGCKPRSAEQIDAMKDYAASIDADIIGLQEVASADALRQLFPESEWQLIVSQRPDSESYECRENGYTSTQQKVAFAVKKSVPVLTVTNLERLALDLPGLRYGLVVTVDSPQGPLDILNVHLKSGCFVDDYLKSDTQACQIYAKQAPVLNEWIAQHITSGIPYVILGDFNHRISAPYNRLTRLLHSNKNSTVVTTRKLIGCHPRYPAPIDHILVGQMNAEAVTQSAQMHPFSNKDENSMLSDHCAVSVSLFDQKGTVSNAVIWQTKSKEYQLLTSGIYQQAIDALKTIPASQENWVVVMDVDETVLDNSGYQRAQELAGSSYSPETWNAWVKSERASLVPGVKAFIEQVYAKGGKIALITNRNTELDAHTWSNLLSLDIPVTAQNTCLIGRSKADVKAISSAEYNNDKDLRRHQLKQGIAKCYSTKTADTKTWKASHSIVMQIGDNIEDFAGITQQEAKIELLLPQLGKKLFLLPNPMYGSWK